MMEEIRNRRHISIFLSIVGSVTLPIWLFFVEDVMLNQDVSLSGLGSGALVMLILYMLYNDNQLR